MLKKLLSFDLVIFGLFCGITFIAYGAYMPQTRRLTITGKLQIIATDVLIIAGIVTMF